MTLYIAEGYFKMSINIYNIVRRYINIYHKAVIHSQAMLFLIFKLHEKYRQNTIN